MIPAKTNIWFPSSYRKEYKLLKRDGIYNFKMYTTLNKEHWEKVRVKHTNTSREMSLSSYSLKGIGFKEKETH